MAEPDCSGSSLTGRPECSRKRARESSESGSIPSSPCGACKFLRRKCARDCIFAPHFDSEHGNVLFAAVHKVFGAGNVSKLLVQLPPQWRHPAVVTISYEAQARLFDPVFGCVSTIIALQKQVAILQTEIAMVKNRLVTSNTFQGSEQPAANNNVLNMSSFDSSLQNIAGDRQNAVHLQLNFDHLQFSQFWHGDEDDNDEMVTCRWAP